MSISLITALAVGGGLLGLALRTDEQRRQAPSLPLPADSDGGDVTVLLPVRDEAVNVDACLDTLLSQTAAPLVRVIDDGSTDGTAALVEARLAAEPRLSLRSAGPLPDGWRGKLHALAAGARDVQTPWILSTDADTRHGPELLARARAAADEHGLDAISLAGTQETRGLGENLLTPTVFALLDILLGDWGPVARGDGAPVANGQFILLQRDAWECCGGFESVRGEAIDDVAVAARLRACGYRSGFFRSPELRVRMYRGLRETARGWRRNLGGIFGPAPGTTAAALAVLLVPAAPLLGFALAGAWVAAFLLWTAGAAASMILRAGAGYPPAYGLVYPLDALLLAAVLILGTLDRRRGRLVSWKGREMRV
ncbi:MAG TPA: glycosyltransferase family 2 protein [Thermoanaerobaculia bacterium]|nr:glycosyltransferase family 2 protein [Thermoanaerobaculia bacterium]